MNSSPTLLEDEAGTASVVYNEVHGTEGNDRGRNRVKGTDEADKIFDHDGRDVIEGGAGADVFVMALDRDKDVIRDFEDGVDMIDLSAWDVSGFDDLRIFQKGEHTRVRYGSETVELRNVDADELSADDFLFG